MQICTRYINLLEEMALRKVAKRVHGKDGDFHRTSSSSGKSEC